MNKTKNELPIGHKADLSCFCQPQPVIECPRCFGVSCPACNYHGYIKIYNEELINAGYKIILIHH